MTYLYKQHPNKQQSGEHGADKETPASPAGGDGYTNAGRSGLPCPGAVRDLTGEEHRIGKEMYQVVQARSSDCERLGAVTNT